MARHSFEFSQGLRVCKLKHSYVTNAIINPQSEVVKECEGESENESESESKSESESSEFTPSDEEE